MTLKSHANAPHVDVMILNFNGEKYLDRCLSSLEKTDYPDFSTILIDNHSSDKSLELVRNKYPRVIIIENKRNLGFGKAYDQAFRRRTSDFWALLNNDTCVDPNWLKPLVRAMMENENLAAVSSKLLFMEHPQVINHAGGGMNFIGLGFDMGIFEPDGQPYSVPKDVFFPSGAACLMRRSAYEKVGGFDPDFFMYHEDVDLGWRFHLFGYQVQNIPESEVYHAFGGSSLKISGMSFRNNLGYRHALCSLIKNYQWKNLAKAFPRLLALGFYAYLRNNSIHFIKCLLWNIYHFPSSLQKRIAVQKNRVRTDKEISGCIWPHLHLPVYFPDYSIQTIDSVAGTGNKNQFITMDEKAGNNLGYGWYGPDHLDFPGMFYRWSRNEAVFFIRTDHEHIKIVIQAVAFASTLGRSRQFHFYIRNNPVRTVSINSDDMEYIELEHSGPSDPLEIRILCEDTWIPDQVYHNQDYRKLGLGVTWVSTAPASGDKRPYSGISVIIPTYNRCDNLVKVLEALKNQSLSENLYEVIVVDDGSTDKTGCKVARFMADTSMQLTYIKQKNKKQGAARNNGLNYATMPLVAFIGDDIIPSPDFLKAHLLKHNHENINDKLVVIGHTRWSQDLSVSPFMEYIHEYGHQFGFSIMDNINNLPFNFFYTSNISLSGKFLQDQDIVFDESFDTYGWEDIELGYRLMNEGMRLCFEDKAVAFHEHPMDIRSFCRRQFNVGKSSRSFLKKHPELGTFLGKENLGNWTRYQLPARALAILANGVDHKNIKLPHKIYNFVLHTFYCLGAQKQD